MRILIIVIVLMIFSSISQADIKSFIEFDTTKFAPRNGGIPRVHVGSFEFEQLPAPLKPTRVSFTLTAIEHSIKKLDEDDWQIKLFYEDNQVQILSDTIFYWPGPHKPGDQYTNSFVFKPLMAGPWRILLAIPGIGNGIAFEWCLDADGNLLYLDQEKALREPCNAIKPVTFFEDSVLLLQSPESKRTWPFECEILIKPPPRIGDTSTISYKLRSNQDIPKHCEAKFRFYNMDVIPITDKLDFPLSKDQLIYNKLKFVPKKVRRGHKILLNYTGCSTGTKSGRDRQSIKCSFVFNQDGTLRYASTGSLGSVPENLLPKSLPEPDPSKRPVEIILNSER